MKKFLLWVFILVIAYNVYQDFLKKPLYNHFGSQIQVVSGTVANYIPEPIKSINFKLEHFLNPEPEPGENYVFVTKSCGTYCVKALNLLEGRKLEFLVVDIEADEGGEELFKELGGTNSLPFMAFGSAKIHGYSKPQILSILAKLYGYESLRSSEQYVLQSHFDGQGKPNLIIYGADWCPGCKFIKSYLKNKNINYIYYDVEKNAEAQTSFSTLGGSGYPFVFIGFNFIGDTSEKKFAKAIERYL